MKYVRVDKPDQHGVASVVLCRADRLNTMNVEFFYEVGEAFRQVEADPDVRVVILRAEGRLFSAGLNLKEAAASMQLPKGLPAQHNVRFYQQLKKMQAGFDAIRKCPKPVIAAVHSLCIGGACDLILACDIRIATRDAKFSIEEVKVGMCADLGTLQRIASVVGEAYAREMALTGARFSADWAARVGFINRVVEDNAALLAEAGKIARQIASNSPLAVQGSKVALNYAATHSLDDALEQSALWSTAFFLSDDVNESVQAFIQKRKPVFRNRL